MMPPEHPRLLTRARDGPRRAEAAASKDNPQQPNEGPAANEFRRSSGYRQAAFDSGDELDHMQDALFSKHTAPPKT